MKNSSRQVDKDLQLAKFLNIGLVIALPGMYFLAKIPFEILVILFLAAQGIMAYLYFTILLTLLISGVEYTVSEIEKAAILGGGSHSIKRKVIKVNSKEELNDALKDLNSLLDDEEIK